MTPLDDLGNFGLQHQIWGYVIMGPGSLEKDACLSEDRTGEFWNPYWDLTHAELAGNCVHIQGQWQRVPDWHALTHLSWQMRSQALREWRGEA